MKNLLFLILFIFSFTAFAQIGPKFIGAELSSSGYHPGEKAVLTVYKLALPNSANLKLSVEAQLTSPDNTVATFVLNEITNDVVMGISNSLIQNGNYSLQIKAYLEEPGEILPLKEFIEENHKRICKIDLLLETESDSSVRASLLAEKSDRIADIAIAKAQISSSRELLQTETIAFSVSSNLSPNIVAGVWPNGVTKLLAQVEEFSGNLVTVIICSNLRVLDPEEGSNYKWKVNFGDGNEVVFNNKSYNPYFFQDYGCVEHSYFDNVRPTVTYTAFDSQGASFTMSQTFDFRKNIPTPVPNLKVKSAQRVTTQSGGPGIKVVFDPFKTSTPSDSGIYVHRYFPYGRCANLQFCPDFYRQQVPLSDFEFTYTAQGTFYLQYFIKDNLQFFDAVRAPVKINFTTFPVNPSQSHIDEAFGPAAIIKASRNNIEMTDLNNGVEVKFDGSKSFDLSGDDSKLTYYWDFGDTFSGNNFSRSKKTSHVYKNPGHYYVYLFVRDEHGNESIDDWINIHVTHPSLQEAQPEFFAYKSNSNPLQIMFSAEQLVRLGATANKQFFWDYGDGTNDSTTRRTIATKIYQQPGIYNVKVTFQDLSGEFVTLEKSIDTTSAVTGPVMTSGGFIPADFADVGTEVEIFADFADPTGIKYWWNFDEAKFAAGGIEESHQFVTFNVSGVKHASLNVTNDSDFTSEFRSLYSVGTRKLELSQYDVTNQGPNTKVDFKVSVPSIPQEIKRIEISNFNRGWAVIENPTSLSGSVDIEGSGTVTIIVTDQTGNKRAFVKNAQKALEDKKFNISEAFENEIRRADLYLEHVTDQPRI